MRQSYQRNEMGAFISVQVSGFPVCNVIPMAPSDELPSPSKCDVRQEVLYSELRRPTVGIVRTTFVAGRGGPDGRASKARKELHMFLKPEVGHQYTQRT